MSEAIVPPGLPSGAITTTEAALPIPALLMHGLRTLDPVRSKPSSLPLARSTSLMKRAPTPAFVLARVFRLTAPGRLGLSERGHVVVRVDVAGLANVPLNGSRGGEGGAASIMRVVTPPTAPLEKGLSPRAPGASSTSDRRQPTGLLEPGRLDQREPREKRPCGPVRWGYPQRRPGASPLAERAPAHPVVRSPTSIL